MVFRIGSILGPLLFNIFLNDMNFLNISCSLQLHVYADDTRVYSSGTNPPTLEMNLQTNLNLLTTSFRANFLIVNHTYCNLNQSP